MIGIVILGNLRDPEWDWKLLYKISGKSILEHTFLSASDVEVAHNITICLDLKDSSQLSGSAFNLPVINKEIILKDQRAKFLFSDKKDWIGKVYDSCIKHGLSTVAIINADGPLIPSWLIKDTIMYGLESGHVVETMDYPKGINVAVYPFHIIASIYRFRDFPDKLKEYYDSIKIASFPNRPGGETYIYNEIKDLSITKREQIPMFDAIIEDLGRGQDLSDLLKEWYEQKSAP